MKLYMSLFGPKAPLYLTYMLQQVEYEHGKFYDWIARLIQAKKSLRSVMNRQKLIMTKRAKILVSMIYLMYALGIFFAVWALVDSGFSVLSLALFFGSLLFLPLEVEAALFLVLLAANTVIIKPEQKRAYEQARDIFAKQKAVKIAVLGSYGKTTMKELLVTILSEGKRVASTPGNMNVTTSHARFAKKLTGNEDVIIVEFGEGEPGDIERMADMLKPDYAIITGLAPNHLDHYLNLEQVAKDLLNIYDFVPIDNVFVNGDSIMLHEYLPKDSVKYSHAGALDWKVGDVKLRPNELMFNLRSKGNKISVTSRVIGRHQIGPLSIVSALADRLGLSAKQIESGLLKTHAFDHRMQPRLVNGAWLIDDTYNGNLEGMQAGLKFISEIDAKRRWYVTPGLVDQGEETENVHVELGRSIAESKVDILVLMENSVRQIIQDSAVRHGFSGEVRIEHNPLDFYQNIEHLVAAGDVVVMQNDWTDNYN